jgi:hypothetical protein
LLLQLGDVVRRVAGRYGSAFYRNEGGLGGNLGAEYAALRGGAECGYREHCFDYRVGSYTRLVADPVAVGQQ